MSPGLPELAAKLISGAINESTPPTTLTGYLRLQKCLTASELAALFHSSKSTIDRWRCRDGLPAHWAGRWKYFGPEVAAWQVRRDTNRVTIARQRRTTETFRAPAKPSYSRDAAGSGVNASHLQGDLSVECTLHTTELKHK